MAFSRPKKQLEVERSMELSQQVQLALFYEGFEQSVQSLVRLLEKFGAVCEGRIPVTGLEANVSSARIMEAELGCHLETCGNNKLLSDLERLGMVERVLQCIGNTVSVEVSEKFSTNYVWKDIVAPFPLRMLQRIIQPIAWNRQITPAHPIFPARVITDENWRTAMNTIFQAEGQHRMKLKEYNDPSYVLPRIHSGAGIKENQAILKGWEVMKKIFPPEAEDLQNKYDSLVRTQRPKVYSADLSHRTSDLSSHTIAQNTSHGTSSSRPGLCVSGVAAIDHCGKIADGFDATWHQSQSIHMEMQENAVVGDGSREVDIDSDHEAWEKAGRQKKKQPARGTHDRHH